MSATVDTVRAPLAPVQAAPPKPVAEVLELFPGSKSARLPTHLHSAGGARRGRRSGDPAVPKQSKMRLMGSELGMATAEYAIATLAAVGFAGLLVVILRSEEVRGFLLNLIRSALSLP